MQFIFWQIILSIHQSAFLKALSCDHGVTLVVEKGINSKRINEGWNIPDMGNVKIVMSPSDLEIKKIMYSNKNAIHIFSGISAYPLVKKAFFWGRHLNVRSLMISEPYNFLGIKGIIRRYRKMIEFIRYGKYIDGLLHTGELGYYWFRKAGFPSNKLFHWGYFTERTVNIGDYEKATREKASILFVGCIDKRKNILELASVARNNASLFENFTIVGIGPLENELMEIINNTPNIKYIGRLGNDEVHKLMQTYDILVLPSIFDGWGAVVNEALQNGMQVICSENCGAYSLLDNKERGEIFYFKKGDNLETVLKKWLKKGPISIKHRKDIIEWSKNSISGRAASEYFIQICSYIFEGKMKKPVAPWIMI